jgi:hypothetical protein
LLKFLMAGLSLFVLAGCAALAGLFSSGGNSGTPSAVGPAAGAATQSVPSLLDQVEPSTRLAIFSPASLLDENASLEQTVVASQCRFRTADPPFLVPNPNSDKAWTFYGRVDEARAADGQPATDAQALEYRSWFGFGTPKQQINTWPLTMVALSQMPAQYLNERMVMLTDHQQQIDKDDTNALAHQYIENSRNIQRRVQLLVNTFDPSKCPSD